MPTDVPQHVLPLAKEHEQPCNLFVQSERLHTIRMSTYNLKFWRHIHWM